MSQNIIQVQPRTCFKCRYEASIDHTNCPNCGGKMKTRGQIRFLGFVLTLLSGFIIVFIGMIASYLYGLAGETGKPGTTARFNGSKSDLVMIFALLGFVILFGCVGFIAGFWQLIFGKRNATLVYSVLALGVILYIGAIVFQFYVGK